MRKLILLLALLAGVFACFSKNTNDPKKITAKKAYEMMQDGDPYILLDVRTLEEYEEGHIFNSLLLPYTELEAEASHKLPDQDVRILLYCRSGRRSAIAAETLANLGYQTIYDFGGILEWPYDIE